jgi:hypothetical protein
MCYTTKTMSTIPFRGYERVYDVGLLDDLHNFFPALLYQPTRFDTVRDVLEYIIQQTQDHFNLFNRGFRNYRDTTQPTVRRTPAGGATVTGVNETVHITPITTRAVGTAPRGTDGNAGRATTTTTAAGPQAAQTQPVVIPNATTTNLNVGIGALDPNDTQIIQGVQGLLNLMGGGLLNGGLLNGGGAMFNGGGLVDLGLFNGLLNVGGAEGFPQNLTPVVVAPTTDQITAATDVRMATTADETQVCSVCQESIVDGQALRILRHCHHTFHRNCIDPWFRTSVRCPVCRHDIREDVAPDENEDGTGLEQMD